MSWCRSVATKEKLKLRFTYQRFPHTSVHLNVTWTIRKTNEENKLLLVHTSGFQSKDSCVNQLLSIVHNLYKAFDGYPTLKTCGVFLDMSKTFDKVWHQGIIIKLNSIGVSDSLLSLIESFLSNRFQRVLLNDQTSKWLPIKAGVPQSSILG